MAPRLELHITGVGVTQSRSLADAEATVRDYISQDLDIPEDSFQVSIVSEVGNGVDQKVGQTREDGEH